LILLKIFTQHSLWRSIWYHSIAR